MKSKKPQSFYKRLKRTQNPAAERFVDLSLDIADTLYEYFDSTDLKRKDFAKQIDKKPAEISKWLSGLHNFTLRTIAKIESVGGVRLILTMPEHEKALIQQEKKYIRQIKKLLKKNAELEEELKMRPISGFVLPTLYSADTAWDCFILGKGELKRTSGTALLSEGVIHVHGQKEYSNRLRGTTVNINLEQVTEKRRQA